MAKKVVEVDQEVIAARSKIDALVAEYKEIEVEKAELTALFEARVSELEEVYKSKSLGLDADMERIKGYITGYFDLAEAKNTNTLKKLSLLAGEVVIKKSALTMKPNRVELIQWAKSSGMNEFVKVKTTEDFDWMAFKKCLVFQQDIDGSYKVMDTQIGEVLEFVDVVEEPESMVIK